MTSLPFDYERPDSVKQALSLIADPGSVVLAGGQSLVPLLNRRVVTPKRIVDITRIPDLKKIELGDDVMRIGAIVRLADIEKHAALAHFPLLAEAIASTASPAIRNRATLIGNLVRASAMSELAVVSVALGARLVIGQKGGTRSSAVADFLVGHHSSGVASYLEADAKGVIVKARIVAGGIAGKPTRCAKSEAALIGQASADVAGCLVAEDITFAPELPHAAYALEVLPVVMSRAVARAAENIQPV